MDKNIFPNLNKSKSYPKTNIVLNKIYVSLYIKTINYYIYIKEFVNYIDYSII